MLDIPLPELQCLKTLKIAFHHATKDEVSVSRFIYHLLGKCVKFSTSNRVILPQVVIHTIRLPKQCAVEDVINDLKSKVNQITKIDILCCKPY